jgi:hypothetical protein
MIVFSSKFTSRHSSDKTELRLIADHEGKAKTGRERITIDTAREFDTLNPSLAAVIRDDDLRKEREKAECERKEAEASKKLRAAVMELAAKFGKNANIVTDAREGKDYSGLMLGTAERGGRYYALQYIGDGHVIRHGTAKDRLPAIEALKGKHVGISCDGNGDIRAIREEPEQRDRSRGFSR